MPDYRTAIERQLEEARSRLQQANDQIRAIKRQRKETKTQITALVGALQLIEIQERDAAQTGEKAGKVPMPEPSEG